MDKTQTTLRLAPELKSWLELLADKNGRSLNAQVVWTLKQEVEKFRKENPEVQLNLLTK